MTTPRKKTISHPVPILCYTYLTNRERDGKGALDFPFPLPPPASVRGLFKSQQKNFIIQVVGKDKAEESTQHASVIVQSKINVTVSSKCENFFVLDSLRV